MMEEMRFYQVLKEIETKKEELESLRRDLHLIFLSDVSNRPDFFVGHDFDGFWPALLAYADEYWGGFGDENFNAFKELLKFDEFETFHKNRKTVEGRLAIIALLDDIMSIGRKRP
jgi:hypothetical protein